MRVINRLASPRRIRTDLMARSALCGALTTAFGLLVPFQARASSGPTLVPGLPVQAPTRPQVAGGNANQPLVSVTGHTMTVGTDAARTLIDWNSFTVAQGNAVNFTFDNRSDIVLNRLVNSTPVLINGSLSGTVGGNIGGNVWFSAPGGVVFGSTAVVNVGGMIATTALVDVNSFLNPGNTSSFPFAYPGPGIQAPPDTRRGPTSQARSPTRPAPPIRPSTAIRPATSRAASAASPCRPAPSSRPRAA